MSDKTKAFLKDCMAGMAEYPDKYFDLAIVDPDYAKPGDKIIDTHLGSGSSRIAAYDMGFDFTGYEKEPDYFSAQEKRFMQFKSQTKLFV